MTIAGARRADLSELYGTLAGRLEQIVRRDVGACDVVVEDACQFAWWRLVSLGDRVRCDSALGWLVTTAVHEAWKLVGRQRREVSLEVALAEALPAPESLGPHELACSRERLRSVDRLPLRQQRMLWLRALGLSYSEVAAYESCTRRTVERQLLRARQGGRPAAGK